MAEPSGRDLLSEWRQVMESVISGAAAAAGRSELPRELIRASQRQLELVQQIVESERSRVEGLLGPAQAAFDLLADSGATLRKQAEAMESAGQALQDTALLMKQQAELLEKVIGLMRQPTGIARAAARTARGNKGDRAGGKRGSGSSRDRSDAGV
ncbi:MAG TPA: hypothetical protein VFW29_05640 [Solirubrobacteraceae bacterium]|nr:hypothetical protein [Solirubrobacteraceae bacterium]